MSRTLKLILVINVLVLVVLTFTYPHLMVGPGKLIAGHQSINADCFACHTSLTGVQSTKCVVCHKATDIGRLTTTGAPVVKPLTNTPFHQELISQRQALPGARTLQPCVIEEGCQRQVPDLPQGPRRHAAPANIGQLRAMPYTEQVDPRHV